MPCFSRWAGQAGVAGEGHRGREGGREEKAWTPEGREGRADPRSHPNVNLSTALSTSVDWPSWASGPRSSMRMPLTVA